MAILNTADDTNNFEKNGTSSDDFYYVDNEKVQINENENGGEDIIYSPISYALCDNIENLTLTTMLDAEKIELPDGTIGFLYGHPAKYKLDNCQGNSSLVINGYIPAGTCGIVSVKNILIQAGILPEDSEDIINQSNISYINDEYLYTDYSDRNNPISYPIDPNLLDSIEGELIEYAQEHFYVDDQGTTNNLQRQLLLNHWGNISASAFAISPSFNLLGTFLKDGKGVILNIKKENGNHSITLTGVVYNEDETINGFYICDSENHSTYAEYVPLNDFELYDIIGYIVTDTDIKSRDIDINGTGNELDNVITGNIGNNILKGESGNDVLVGNEGKDTLYGGIDDDVLIAGVAKKTNQSGEKEDLSNEELKGLINQKTNIVVENFESEKGIGSNLYGGEGNDLLIGDKGNDVLVAGSGSDYLYGGAGRDVLCNYANSSFLNGGYGDDRYDLKTGTTNIIRDTDNKGEVYIKEYWLRGAEAKYYLGNNVWHKDNITYAWNEDAEKLFIQKQGESEITTIEDYHYGALSIKLDKPKVEEIYADGQLQDPLVFDMNGDGIKTSISAYQGIYYDYNNDGFAEKMAWAADGDGVLVADINNDGEIQGSSDILTGLTLTEYDTNQDGKINKQDENFNNLKIMDEDGNVFSLEDAGIASIDITNTEETNYTDENGNHCIKTGTYTTVDGETRQYGEYMMQTITENALELNKLEETQAVAELPDIENSGIVHSLHQAMLRDANLQTLVTSFTTETNDNVRMNLLEQIILKWTGAENVETDSRGDYINAQHLAVIEAFEGIDFYSEYDAQYGEEGTNPSNPNKVRRLVRRLGFNSTELIEREESKVA